MTFQLRVAALVVLAFAVFPAVALAGEDTSKSEERLANLQADVNEFVKCLNGQSLDVASIDVSAVKGQRTLAHRGRGFGRWGFRGFGRGGSSGKAARLVVREAGLDRTDEAVRDAVRACKEAELEARAAERQSQVDALASCLEGKEYEGVKSLDVAERPWLAARRGFLGRATRMIARNAGLDWTDETVRADLKDCRDAAKAAAAA